MFFSLTFSFTYQSNILFNFPQRHQKMGILFITLAHLVSAAYQKMWCLLLIKVAQCMAEK